MHDTSLLLKYQRSGTRAKYQLQMDQFIHSSYCWDTTTYFLYREDRRKNNITYSYQTKINSKCTISLLDFMVVVTSAKVTEQNRSILATRWCQLTRSCYTIKVPKDFWEDTVLRCLPARLPPKTRPKQWKLQHCHKLNTVRVFSVGSLCNLKSAPQGCCNFVEGFTYYTF